MTGRNPLTTGAFVLAKQRRERMVEYVRQGMSVGEARVKVGWTSAQALQYNRREYPEFARDLDLAKTSGRNLRTAVKDAQYDRQARKVRPGPKKGWREDHTPSVVFQQFVAQYFPDRLPHKPQQVMIVDELENLRPREICLFNLWPEAGKTSTIEDYICKKLTEEPNHRFRIVSEGQDLAKRIIGTCQRRFTEEGEYPAFIARYGPFYEKGQERRGRPWAADQFTVLQNDGGERDRSLVASGWTSQVYGSRIDTLILDDIQSQGNYNQAEEITRRIRGTFFNRGLEMRTLIVGTRIGPGDFYERILDAGLVTRHVRLAAADADGNCRVPEFWDRQVFHTGPDEPVGPCCRGFRTCPRNGEKLTPREFMELIRHQSGEETWFAAYQQNPSADERSTFATLIERCYDHDRAYGTLEKIKVPA